MIKLKNTLTFFVLILLVTACGEAPTTEQVQTEKDKVTEVDKLKRDNTKNKRNKRNNDWYVYEYLTLENRTTATDELPTKTPEEVKSNQASDAEEMLKLDLEEPVYEVSTTTRPPIFNPDCLLEDDPETCSNEALEDFVKKNIVYPKGAINKNHDGYEMVSFTINQKGEVASDIRVASKEEYPCDECAKAAAIVITEMDQWAPALRNGEAISVKVTLPIRFDTKRK